MSVRSCDYDRYFRERMSAVAHGLLTLRRDRGLKVCQGSPICSVDEVAREWWIKAEDCKYCDRYFKCLNGLVTVIKGADPKELGN